jgi:His Kinase A (phospho-acceptor) domain
MQDSREIDYFGQRILQIVQPLAGNEDRREVLTLLAQSVASNFGADGCWVLQYVSPGVARMAASACNSHRTNSISTQILEYTLPTAPTPTLWRMPLLPDYQVMAIETRDLERATGCVVVATKGVEWYQETKLVLQVVADYVGVALIEADLQVQAQIAQVFPKLHNRLTQAIVENQPIERLFDLAVSDMVKALKLKRGLVLKLRASDLSKQLPSQVNITTEAEDRAASTLLADISALEVSEWDRPSETAVVESPPPPEIAAPIESAKNLTQIQIVTTTDLPTGDLPPSLQSFLLTNSHLCQMALANAPSPTVFDGNNGNNRSTSTDRLIFQDDRFSSIAMIPLMGAASPDRQPADAVWGWLVLQHDRSRHWHPVELKLLQCQIYQIALARIHRKALKQARNTVANRTSQVQTSLQLQAKLHDVGRKRMEKLRQANELKDEFISTISHELRTPLTSMSLAIKMLRQVDVDPDRRAQYLDILEDQCQREIKLVNDPNGFRSISLSPNRRLLLPIDGKRAKPWS